MNCSFPTNLALKSQLFLALKWFFKRVSKKLWMENVFHLGIKWDPDALILFSSSSDSLLPYCQPGSRLMVWVRKYHHLSNNRAEINPSDVRLMFLYRNTLLKRSNSWSASISEYCEEWDCECFLRNMQLYKEVGGMRWPKHSSELQNSEAISASIYRWKMERGVKWLAVGSGWEISAGLTTGTLTSISVWTTVNPLQINNHNSAFQLLSDHLIWPVDVKMKGPACCG